MKKKKNLLLQKQQKSSGKWFPRLIIIGVSKGIMTAYMKANEWNQTPKMI